MIHLLLMVSLLLSPLAVTRDQQTRATDTRTRTIYVSALDGEGKPVTDMTAADFIVREDGVAREVLKAGPATEQLTISILVDDSQASSDSIQYLRDGLQSFVDKLSGKADIALASIGERPTSLVDYTTSGEALKKAINRIFARPGSGAYLLDGIVDVSKGLQKREAMRPTIVVLTFERGPEFSNRYYESVLDELLKSKAALHVLAIGTPSDDQSDEMRNRNLVIAEGTLRTGGRRDQLLASLSIPERMRQVADELLNQYIVTYSAPETLIPPTKVEVSTKRSGVTVRARTRLAGK